MFLSHTFEFVFFGSQWNLLDAHNVNRNFEFFRKKNYLQFFFQRKFLWYLTWFNFCNSILYFVCAELYFLLETLKFSLWENVIITRPTFCYAWSFFECWIWGKIIKNKVLTRNDFSFKYIDSGEFMPISWKWTDLQNCLGALISWSSYRIKSDQGMNRNYFQSGLTGGWDTLKPSQNNNELGKNLSWVEANSTEIIFLYNICITKVDITIIITVMVKIFGKLKAMKFFQVWTVRYYYPLSQTSRRQQ